MSIRCWLVAGLVTIGQSAPAFAKHHGGGELPPGLQMNHERGKPLPPGWQKKLKVGDVLDKQVYEQGQVVARRDGVITIRVDDRLIRLAKDTREILAILSGR